MTRSLIAAALLAAMCCGSAEAQTSGLVTVSIAKEMFDEHSYWNVMCKTLLAERDFDYASIKAPSFEKEECLLVGDGTLTKIEPEFRIWAYSRFLQLNDEEKSKRKKKFDNPPQLTITTLQVDKELTKALLSLMRSAAYSATQYCRTFKPANGRVMNVMDDTNHYLIPSSQYDEGAAKVHASRLSQFPAAKALTEGLESVCANFIPEGMEALQSTIADLARLKQMFDDCVPAEHRE